MSIKINDDGSIRAKGKDAQALFDALTASLPEPERLKAGISKRMGLPKLSPNHVSHQLRAINESFCSMRNAVRCSAVEGTPRELARLAEEIENVGRRAFALAEDFRRGK